MDPPPRKVYVGNLDAKVTEPILHDLFVRIGQVEQCKVMRDRETGLSAGYAFVDFVTPQAAVAAIQTMNQRTLFGRELKVNWAHHSAQKEDTGMTLFVGDLASDVDDAALFKSFSAMGVVSEARVMWDPLTKKSRGFGFVTFRSREQAERAMKEMNGQSLGSRVIRVNWAVKAPANGTPRTAGSADQRDSERASRTVYVGNLSSDVSDQQLQAQFHEIGVIEEIRCNAAKGYGFVTFASSAEATRAIETMNGRVIGSRAIKVAWGREKDKSNQFGVPPSFLGQLIPAQPLPHFQQFYPTALPNYNQMMFPYSHNLVYPSNMYSSTMDYAQHPTLRPEWFGHLRGWYGGDVTTPPSDNRMVSLETDHQTATATAAAATAAAQTPATTQVISPSPNLRR